MSTPHNLTYLRALLAGLPSLPLVRNPADSVYKFHEFGLSDEVVDELGIVGAVNRELEVRLGPRTGRRDTFELKERGPGVVALVDVLENFIGQYPGDVLLEKWVADACRAAEIVYNDENVPLPVSPAADVVEVASDSDTISWSESESSTSEAEEVALHVQQKKKQKAASKKGAKTTKKATSKGSKKKKNKKAGNQQAASKRSDVKVLETFEDDRFIDVDELQDTRAGGGKVDPALLKVSRPCFPRFGYGDDPDKRVRCLASRGCNVTWNWPRPRGRILDHAMECDWLPAELKDVAQTSIALKGEKKLSKLIPQRRKLSLSSSSGDTRLVEDSHKPKRSRNDPSPTQAPERKSDHATAPTTSDGGPLSQFVKQGTKNLKENGDHHLTLYIVGCGVAPRNIDTGFFKNFVSSIQPKYKPPSSTTMRDRLIPTEAAKCNLALIAELRQMRNLTISFDGGKIRRPRSIYTVSVTTPEDRKSYLLKLSDASRVSHTANYITNEVVGPILTKLGPENVSAVVSDNTGNTRKARELIVKKFLHILNFQDCCHEMNLALLQISELDEFKETIQDVKEVLSFMHHSTYTMEHFNEARKELNIDTGLAHIVATRFWTYVAAVDSVYRGLPAFRKIVANAELGIDIASKNELFEKQSVASVMFETKLVQFLAITTPFARAIKCLESASSTASDVYAFWLAIMSRLEYIMASGHRTGLQASTKEDIRAIANQRFKELLDEGPEDVYIAAFLLDPRYRDAPILNDTNGTNPLAIRSIRIRCNEGGTPTVVSASPGDDHEKLVKRVGICLQGLLLREYGGLETIDRPDIGDLMKIRNPLLASVPPLEAYEKLKTQLRAYVKGREPFDRKLRPKDTVLDWWTKVQADDDADVLGAIAIKIFSAVINSMADERAMSVITWLNGPRRAAQHVKTVSHYVTIRQYHINKDPSLAYAAQSRDSRRHVPTLRRWCDLAPDSRAAVVDVQAVPAGSGEGGEGGESDSELEESEESREKAQNEAVEALRESAYMGPLENERRGEFIANDEFDLKAPFLREMLADDDEVDRGQVASAGASSTARARTVATEGGNAAAANSTQGPKPSLAAWNEW